MTGPTTSGASVRVALGRFADLVVIVVAAGDGAAGRHRVHRAIKYGLGDCPRWRFDRAVPASFRSEGGWCPKARAGVDPLALLAAVHDHRWLFWRDVQTKITSRAQNVSIL